MKHKNFIGKAVTELIDDKFSVMISNEAQIDGCAGWFDFEKKELITCMGNRLGMEVFVHEYSHYQQYKTEKSKFLKWNKATTRFFGWVHDKEKYEDDVIDQDLLTTIELEHDCEQKAIKLIKQYKLDIDITEYAKAAGAYLFFYHMVREKRKWATTKSAYNPAISKLMPDKLMSLEFYQDPSNITKRMRTQYEKVLS